jgi:hypothetical protein
MHTVFSTFGLLFYPEDGDIKFLQNFGKELLDYVVSCHKTVIFICNQLLVQYLHVVTRLKVKGEIVPVLNSLSTTP